MKGLELSEEYYRKYGRPSLELYYPHLMERISVGMVGEGSDCFRYDDIYSRDHDWGPGFCLWLSQKDFAEFGSSLQNWYKSLPQYYAGFPARTDYAEIGGRVGVFETQDFFSRLLGMREIPLNLGQWLRIPEYGLASATNGQVFHDACDDFSEFRQALTKYYPEDIRKKKIAYRCMMVGQSGQYNYMRCVRHGEMIAARLALLKFTESVIAMVFLFNRRYAPFYKWAYRAMTSLPLLGNEVGRKLQMLDFGIGSEKIIRENFTLVESISHYLRMELLRQGLSNVDSNFLFDHGPTVQIKIEDPMLKAADLMQG